MKHTPGPWTVEMFPSGSVYIHMRKASGKNGPAIFGPDFSDQDGHVGAHTFLHNVSAFKALTGETEEQLHEERVANAYLIAAAPDLLEALKGLKENGCFYDAHGPGCWCSKAAAAIAKAEGRSE